MALRHTPQRRADLINSSNHNVTGCHSTDQGSADLSLGINSIIMDSTVSKGDAVRDPQLPDTEEEGKEQRTNQMHKKKRRAIPAIDAESSKILIPAKNVRRTEALTRDDVTTPALCRLFLVGRCRQSARCHQIHADPDVVQRLRQHALANPSCCMAHTPGECAAAARQVLHLLPPGLTLDVEGTMVGVMQLDPTRGLVELCQKAAFSPVIPCTRSQVCRNHSSGSLCRFGDDCGFVHICKDAPIMLSIVSSSVRQGRRTDDSSAALATSTSSLEQSLRERLPGSHFGAIVTGSNERRESSWLSPALPPAGAESAESGIENHDGHSKLGDSTTCDGIVSMEMFKPKRILDQGAPNSAAACGGLDHSVYGGVLPNPSLLQVHRRPSAHSQSIASTSMSCSGRDALQPSPKVSRGPNHYSHFPYTSRRSVASSSFRSIDESTHARSSEEEE